MTHQPGPELGDLIDLDRPPPAHWKRVLLLCGGILFVLLGFVGWLIPLVTGIPFYIVGFVMLGAASRRCARGINALDRRLPYKARAVLRKAKRRRAKVAEATSTKS